MRHFSTLSLAFFAIALPACSSSTNHLEVDLPHGPNAAAIYAASQDRFSSNRNKIFREIAAKPNLSEHEQIYLIDVTVRQGGFSRDIANVLTTLARNPAITTLARNHLAIQMRRVNLFSSDRRRIAEALARNDGKTPPPNLNTPNKSPANP